VQADLHRVRRDLEQLGGLLGVELFDVAEQQRGAVGLRQPVDLLADPGAGLLALEQTVRAAPLARLVAVQAVVAEVGQQLLDRGLGVAALRAQAHERGVHGDPVQPGRDARLAGKPVDGAERGQEGILHRVLGVGLVAQQPAGHGEQATAVASDQRRVRVLAPLAQRSDELLLGRERRIAIRGMLGGRRRRGAAGGWGGVHVPPT